MKPKNRVKMIITRSKGEKETHVAENDLTLRGARIFGLPENTGPYGSVSRTPGVYACLNPGALDYKTSFISSGSGFLKSNSRSFVEYQEVVTDGGKRYQPRVDKYVFSESPVGSSDFHAVAFVNTATSPGVYTFANMASPVTVNPGDTVEIEYTTYWEVYGNYDGDPNSVYHTYVELGSGSVDVELYDIDGNLVSSTPTPFTVHGVLTVSTPGDTPDQNMNKSGVMRMEDQPYSRLSIAPDLATDFTHLTSSFPKQGTTFEKGFTLEEADSLEPEIPGVAFNYVGLRAPWNINIPAGGTEVQIQAVLMSAVNGASDTPTWSVNQRLAAAPSELTKPQGVVFVFDSVIVAPIEYALTITGEASIKWDPPQGFLDEFPGWVRPT